jgi:ADP-heptose:LPS heptosyltransferase
MRIKAITQKFYYRFYKYIIAGKDSQCFYKGNNNNPKQVIFYLADSKIVHLGDTLWFEPIARFLADYFAVAIYPNPPMEFYFTKLNYKIAHIEDLDKDFTMVIAPIELMFKLKHFKNVLFLSFDYRNVSPGKKLINSMINAVAGHFNLNSEGASGKYQKLGYTKAQIDESLKKSGLSQDEKYILFNNYIDSWGKHTTLDMVNVSVETLIKYAGNYKDKHKEVKFIHTGSKIDKNRDNKQLGNIIDIDLRGVTTVEDLFLLANAPQVIQYIGFDTFLMHLFNMYDKPSHILLKPGNSDKTNQIIKDEVLIPYLNDKYPNLVLINYD